MNEYKTIIEERPYNLHPINIDVIGKLQIKNKYVFGFNADSYMIIPYTLKSDFNKILIKITLKRLMGTQQNILSPVNENCGLKPIFIGKDNRLHYGDFLFGNTINKAKDYEIYLNIFENKIKVTVSDGYEVSDYEPIDIEFNEETQFIIGKGDDNWSSYALNKTFIKVDDKVEWFGGLNTLTYNGAIIDLGFIPNNGLLITDEVKLLQEKDIRISESTPMDSYCYWFKPSTKELWLCSSGMKVKKLQLPSFRVKSNGISVKEIVKYFETQEEAIKAIMGEE